MSDLRNEDFDIGEVPSDPVAADKFHVEGAMARGAWARRCGKPVTACPYADFPGEMLQRRAWLHGWHNCIEVESEPGKPPIRLYE